MHNFYFFNFAIMLGTELTQFTFKNIYYASSLQATQEFIALNYLLVNSFQ